MSEHVAQYIGNYRLLRLIGRGAFAEVYLGKHQYLDVPAAIKILRVQMEPATYEHFRREAHTIAHLQHPHIVRVLDFGLQNQTPYLVMEYISNQTMRSLYPTGTCLPLQHIISYVKQLASALDYAHQQRVIHRDVKPENMLLDANNRVVLSDFGIAVVQRTLDTLSTQNQAGTPVYMAPEQINGKPCPASDQYALAVIVYEWLCGRPPFRGTLFEVYSQHIYQPPPSLRTYQPQITPAIENVVLRALAKEPQQRFASVQDFALALEQAATQSYQQWVPTMAATPYAQTAGFPPTQRMTPPANGANHEYTAQASMRVSPPTRQQQEMAESVRLQATTSASNVKRSTGTTISRRAILSSIAGIIVVGGSAAVLAASGKLETLAKGLTTTTTTTTPTPTQSTQTGRPVGTLLYTYRGHYASGMVFGIGWSPDGKRIVSGSGDRTAQVWGATDGSNVLTYTEHKNTVTAVAWSPDGKRIASASDDATVQIWDAITGKIIQIFRGHVGDVHSVSWSPDGAHLATGGNDQTVHVWDALNGQTQPVFVYHGHSSFVWDVCWSPDGTQIASGSSDKTVQVWDAFTGAIRQTYSGHTDELRGVAWAAHGTRIVSSGLDKTARVWDAVSGNTLVVYDKHTDVIDHAAWSPDSVYIASGSADTTVHVWDATSGNTLYVYRGHIERVRMVQWSPIVESREIASGGYDRLVQVWQAL